MSSGAAGWVLVGAVVVIIVVVVVWGFGGNGGGTGGPGTGPKKLPGAEDKGTCYYAGGNTSATLAECKQMGGYRFVPDDPSMETVDPAEVPL